MTQPAVLARIFISMLPVGLFIRWLANNSGVRLSSASLFSPSRYFLAAELSISRRPRRRPIIGWWWTNARVAKNFGREPSIHRDNRFKTRIAITGFTMAPRIKASRMRTSGAKILSLRPPVLSREDAELSDCAFSAPLQAFWPGTKNPSDGNSLAASELSAPPRRRR